MPPTLPPSPVRPDHMLPPHETNPIGPLIGTIIIVVLLIISGLYFWGAQLNKNNPQPVFIPEATTPAQTS